MHCIIIIVSWVKITEWKRCIAYYMHSCLWSLKFPWNTLIKITMKYTIRWANMATQLHAWNVCVCFNKKSDNDEFDILSRMTYTELDVLQPPRSGCLEYSKASITTFIHSEYEWMRKCVLLNDNLSLKWMSDVPTCLWTWWMHFHNWQYDFSCIDWPGKTDRVNELNASKDWTELIKLRP